MTIENDARVPVVSSLLLLRSVVTPQRLSSLTLLDVGWAEAAVVE